MKKVLALLLAILVFVTVGLCGCSTQPAADGDKNAVDDVLTVGFDANFPPYGYKDKDTGEYTGFDLELAEEVCDRLGWELVKQPIDWDSKDMELNSGTIDCIWNGFTINGREDDYTWSDPYVDNSQVVLVKSGSDIDSLDDLKGKIVTVQADSSALAALTGDEATDANKKLCASFADLIQVAEYNVALMELESGATDAVCMDIGVAKYHLENNPDKYVMLDEKLATEQYGIGFKLGNEDLCDIVEDTLEEMVKDGKFTEIAKKYDLEDAVCYGED